jgi:ABC-type branched-subunit amino acid transport system permease subunit
MKNRSSLALLVGAFGSYWLGHAGYSAYAVYLVGEALQHPAVVMDSDLREMREGYPILIWLLTVTAILGALSLVAGVGLYRNRRWSMPLWLATSSAIILAILYAVAFRGVEWMHYLYEVGMVLLSWYYVVVVRKEGHDQQVL